jgi:ribonuclease HI
MNNAVELWGLTRGLQPAIKNNFTKLTVEGDSLIIINLLWKILNGANPERISPSWRLLHGLQTISDSLRPNLTIIPAHVRRKENQVVDDLVNMGINWSEVELLCNSTLESDHPILQQCIRKSRTTDAPPDGVLVEATWRMQENDVCQQGMEPCDGLVPPSATLLRI